MGKVFEHLEYEYIDKGNKLHPKYILTGAFIGLWLLGNRVVTFHEMIKLCNINDEDLTLLKLKYS